MTPIPGLDRLPIPAERLCGCGCGESITHLRPNARYASDACRTRAWKAKTGYADQRAAKPVRNGNAARKPSLRISYLRAVDAVVDELRRAGVPAWAARQRAEEALRPLLGPKARRYA